MNATLQLLELISCWDFLSFCLVYCVAKLVAGQRVSAGELIVIECKQLRARVKRRDVTATRSTELITVEKKRKNELCCESSGVDCLAFGSEYLVKIWQKGFCQVSVGAKYWHLRAVLLLFLITWHESICFKRSSSLNYSAMVLLFTQYRYFHFTKVQWENFQYNVLSTS